MFSHHCFPEARKDTWLLAGKTAKQFKASLWCNKYQSLLITMRVHTSKQAVQQWKEFPTIIPSHVRWYLKCWQDQVQVEGEYLSCFGFGPLLLHSLLQFLHLFFGSIKNNDIFLLERVSTLQEARGKLDWQTHVFNNAVFTYLLKVNQ